MSILEKIIEWSKTLPKWQSDAIRRIFQGKLINKDEEEIYKLLKTENGLEVENAIEAVPFASKSTVRSSILEKPMLLHRIHSIKNVNKLKDGEEITFQHNGLTIIYGDNASGKSGYGRIFKRACRSRHDGGQILSNLFKDDYSPDNLAQASFDIEVDGKAQTIKWEDNDPPDYDLSRIAIFDKDCARVQVSDENEVDFLPYAADVLPTLARLCDELKLKIQSEIEELSDLPSDFDDLTPDGEARIFLGKLDHQTSQTQVDKITELSASDKTKYQKLRQIVTEIQNSDPKKLAEKHRRLSIKWDNLFQELTDLSRNFNDDSLIQINNLYNSLKAAEKACKILSSKDFLKEPLKGVGSNEWQLMFDAAATYAEKVAYSGRKFEDTFNDRCVLCQQKLKDDAPERLRRFNEFVKGEVKSKLRNLAQRLSEKTEFLKHTVLDPLSEKDEFCEHIKTDYPELFAKIESFLKQIKQRNLILTSGLQTGNWKKTNRLIDINNVLKLIQEISKQEMESAKAFGKKQLTDKQKAQVKDYVNLNERLLLRKYKQQILDYISDLSLGRKLKICERSLNTTPISIKQSSLLKEAVTDELLKSLVDELAELRVTTINPRLNRSSTKAVVSHRITLDGMSAPEIVLSDILSEGEGLVVAIAAFLAELKLAPKFSVVVFDDPVCSLDHHWRERVAKRLVSLSKERQVIVFTHDILFLCELDSQAIKQSMIDKFKLKAIESRGDYSGVPLPDGDLPFDILSVKKRVGRLRSRHQEAAKIFRKVGGNAEQYRECVKSIYSSIRSSWERAVEELLFGNVVVRFRRSVNTQELKNVATGITEDDCAFIESEMTKCSDITDAHDEPGASRKTVPPPDELLADIEKLEIFRKEIEVRRKS